METDHKFLDHTATTCSWRLCSKKRSRCAYLTVVCLRTERETAALNGDIRCKSWHETQNQRLHHERAQKALKLHSWCVHMHLFDGIRDNSLLQGIHPDLPVHLQRYSMVPTGNGNNWTHGWRDRAERGEHNQNLDSTSEMRSNAGPPAYE